MKVETEREVLTAADLVVYLREKADELADQIDARLTNKIKDYHKRRPVPCGHTGGWFLDRKHDDGPIDVEKGEVHLIHECFYAHRYDLDDKYHLTVPLKELL